MGTGISPKEITLDVLLEEIHSIRDKLWKECGGNPGQYGNLVNKSVKGKKVVVLDDRKRKTAAEKIARYSPRP